MRKIISIPVLAFLLGVLFLGMLGMGTAHAWYIELTNVDGTLTEGEYYTMDIYFQGEETDNLETYFAAVRWNESLVSLAGIVYYDYTRPEPPFGEYTLWNGEELPDSPPGSHFGYWDVPSNEYWNINGAENLDHPDEFYPMATGENLLATLWFTAQTSGYYEDIASFINSNTDELVMINDQTLVEAEDFCPLYDGIITFRKQGTSSIIAPVPIPAAVWLLGSGVVGLLGLRRRLAA